ncbi:outer envelope protein [Burkholderiaceae bacterium UC74_6]
MKSKIPLIALSALAGAGAAHAADWSDTSIGARYGTQFREPYNPEDISKYIVNLTHASGYKYGSNFLNVDLLMSDSKDPSNISSGNGAHEAYIVYRHTLDLGKVMGSNLSSPGIRGWGVMAGFDWNTKTDATYNSKKRMFVLGPTVMFDVPGFLNVSLVLLKESNQPSGFSFATNANYSVSRYSYKTHPMLTAAWGINFSDRISWEGYANFIASKGNDEFGGKTKPETNIDMQLMYDVTGTKTFKVGIEYQYWKNKFGNDSGGPAGSGAFAKTPMIRAEYHF